MTDTLPHIRTFLENSKIEFEVMTCDPALADTAVFCEHYGISLDHSANAIVVKTKTGERKYVACVVLATARLDVNHTVRKKIGARKVSFAGAEETLSLTGMDLGGVTPLCLPPDLPLWIDAEIMKRPYIILGGGNRESKIRVLPDIFRLTPNTEIVEGLTLPGPPPTAA
jgi:prolyl-tRNA editing enzyme YbaK/EbsC (Cys-tRNA(Pro) deacylase)